ncbi:MAG: membrane protein [Patescibacteria group bacterium]|nr:MAG: membrane protein [Patescibacteria group bacterium]
MEELSIPIKIALSMILGAIIGLEREINEKKSLDPGKKPIAILGLRSFALISGLGALTGILSVEFLPLSLVISSSFLVLLIAFYVLDSQKTQDFGITTELAMIYSFMLGLLIIFEVIPIHLTIALSIIIILLLSRKEKIQTFIEDIKKEEINAFISYAVIALVILPFLPNKTYALSEIPLIQTLIHNLHLPAEKITDIQLFNPYKVWFIVALITGVDILGYILEKTLGQSRGWILASIAGGFISSTATTQTLAQKSKTAPHSYLLLAASVIANLTSFFQIAIIIIAVNSIFFSKLIPTLISIIFIAFAITLFLIRKHKLEEKKNRETKLQIESHEIFNIGPAIRFTLIFLAINVFSKISLVFFGNSGFLLTIMIGSLAGLDVVMINTAELAGNTINYNLAVTAFILANSINLLSKSLYCYLQGSKEFAWKFFLSMLAIVLGSLVGLLVLQ